MRDLLARLAGIRAEIARLESEAESLRAEILSGIPGIPANLAAVDVDGCRETDAGTLVLSSGIKAGRISASVRSEFRPVRVTGRNALDLAACGKVQTVTETVTPREILDRAPEFAGSVRPVHVLSID